MEMTSQIKSILAQESCIKDSKMFSIQHIPKNFLGRELQVAELTTIYKFIPICQITNSPLSQVHTLVHGNAGAGKTSIVRGWAKEFAAILAESKIFIEYYDCTQYRTKSAILRNMVEKIVMVSGHGYADAELIVSFLKEMQRKKAYTLLILDEIQMLEKEDLLAFLQMNGSFGSQNAPISIICITRTECLPTILTEGITKHISNIVKFEPYSPEIAQAILEDRWNRGCRYPLHVNIKELAKFGAKNMRQAIIFLGNVAKNLDLGKKIEIDPQYFTDAEIDAKLDNLNKHELISLYSIVVGSPDHNTIDLLFPHYEELMNSIFKLAPHVKMTLRKYMRNLRDLGLLSFKMKEPMIDSPGRMEYIHLSYPLEMIKHSIEKRLVK